MCSIKNFANAINLEKKILYLIIIETRIKVLVIRMVKWNELLTVDFEY